MSTKSGALIKARLEPPPKSDLQGMPAPFAEMIPPAPEPPSRTLEVDLDDLEPDSVPSALPRAVVPSEPPQVSKARATFIRVVVGAVLCACIAIMVFAGRRLLQGRHKTAGTPEPSIPQFAPASTAQPAPSETIAVPEAPALATTPTPAMQTPPSVAPPAQRVAPSTKLVRNQGSPPRKPSRTVRASH